MRVINPLADVGTLISALIDGRIWQLEAAVIRLRREGIIIIQSKGMTYELNMIEKTGELISLSDKWEISNIQFRILTDSKSAIVKLEWDLPTQDSSAETQKHYALILFRNNDFDFIIEQTGLEVSPM